MIHAPSLSRREFLAASSAAAIAASPASLLADAPPRDLPARMKLSLAAYSFNKYLPRNWYARGKKPAEAPMSLFDFMDFAAEAGFDAVELTGYYFPKPLEPAMAAEIKNYAFRLGLDVSGTAIGNDFCLPEGPELTDQLELVTVRKADYVASPYLNGG